MLSSSPMSLTNGSIPPGIPGDYKLDVSIASSILKDAISWRRKVIAERVAQKCPGREFRARDSVELSFKPFFSPRHPVYNLPPLHLGKETCDPVVETPDVTKKNRRRRRRRRGTYLPYPAVSDVFAHVITGQPFR